MGKKGKDKVPNLILARLVSPGLPKMFMALLSAWFVKMLCKRKEFGCFHVRLSSTFKTFSLSVCQFILNWNRFKSVC